ncbi:MAG TPA: hypothetical protein DD640_08435 [Clostridiales bacterium]|nr:hypothetical protein [Clostridiales bacterium]
MIVCPVIIALKIRVVKYDFWAGDVSSDGQPDGQFGMFCLIFGYVERIQVRYNIMCSGDLFRLHLPEQTGGTTL